MDTLFIVLDWFWTNFIKIVAVGSMIGGVSFFLLRSRFVTKSEFTKHLNDYNGRMDAVDKRMNSLATHHDVKKLYDAVASIKEQLTATDTKTEMIGQGMSRIDNNIALLTRSMLETDKK